MTTTKEPVLRTEDKYKLSDGTLDMVAISKRLQDLQKSDTLTRDEIREGIDLCRLQRRTNTGPSAPKKSTSKKKGTIDLDDLLSA